MKTIYLLRHAKSSWKDASLEDMQRPLNKRGQQTASVLGRHLADAGIAPATILCSPAVRTRETLEGIAASFVEPIPTRFEQGIYDANANELLQRVRLLNDHLVSVMIVGHNPAMESLLHDLVFPGQPGRANRILNEKFPTGSLAIIESKAQIWADITKRGCSLAQFIYGRELLEAEGA